MGIRMLGKLAAVLLAAGGMLLFAETVKKNGDRTGKQCSCGSPMTYLGYQEWICETCGKMYREEAEKMEPIESVSFDGTEEFWEEDSNP